MMAAWERRVSSLRLFSMVRRMRSKYPGRRPGFLPPATVLVRGFCPCRIPFADFLTLGNDKFLVRSPVKVLDRC